MQLPALPAPDLKVCQFITHQKKCAFYIKEVDYRLTAKINFVRRYFLKTETSSLQTLTEL